MSAIDAVPVPPDDLLLAIDALARRAANSYSDAGRVLSERDSYLFTPFELRSGTFFQNLTHIAEADQTLNLEAIPSEQKREIRAQIQQVYQYLFGSRYHSPHTSNVFLIDQGFQSGPIGQLLNTVRLRLSPDAELLTIGQASQFLGIGRSQGYEWTHSGIFHPVIVRKGNADFMLRIERWEVQLIAYERGIPLSTRPKGQEEESIRTG